MSVEKAREFHAIATEVFSPVYPVLAAQILARFDLVRGTSARFVGGECLDLGSAAGHLGISIARQSRMNVCLADTNPHALALSASLIDSPDLASRVRTTVADACELEFEDEGFDLVVSRGSIWFWQDRPKAVAHLWRILTPGGLAYFGGGFGTARLREHAVATMSARFGGDWREKNMKIRDNVDAAYLAGVFGSLSIPYHIIDDESGLWAVVHKLPSDGKE